MFFLLSLCFLSNIIPHQFPISHFHHCNSLLPVNTFFNHFHIYNNLQMPLFRPTGAFPLSTLREYIFFTNIFFHFTSTICRYSILFSFIWLSFPLFPSPSNADYNEPFTLSATKKSESETFGWYWAQVDWQQLVDCIWLTVFGWLFLVDCPWLTVFGWLHLVDCTLLTVLGWLFFVDCPWLTVFGWLYLVDCTLLIVLGWLFWLTALGWQNLTGCIWLTILGWPSLIACTRLIMLWLTLPRWIHLVGWIKLTDRIWLILPH